MVNIATISTTSYQDQKPGTSGLRKKTSVFLSKPNYLENFIEAVFLTLKDDYPGGFQSETLIIGGDGRFYNTTATQVIIKMAIAHGVGNILVAKDGILSTPAASTIIRKQKAMGGFILSASHNPGGKDGDFGVKFNGKNGGPAQQSITDKIYSFTKELSTFKIAEISDFDLTTLTSHTLESAKIQIINPISDYAELMQKLFDFDRLAAFFAGGFLVKYDAMNAVTGPYATHIFEDLLRAPKGSVIRATPLEDFGGIHPDPNLVYAKDLVDLMYGATPASLGAASDGDGDRNLILGPQCFISPGDSLAIITQHAKQCIPGYKDGLLGVARSMPTSTAVDRVAQALNIPCYETPTGWKFFGNLMDADRCTICGEESFGTGSNHVREKDGLWAVLAWCSIIAETKLSVAELLSSLWSEYGRSYYQRHDYENLNGDKASLMFDELRTQAASLTGKSFAGRNISLADDFSYIDPIDNSTTKNQGIRIILDNDSRVIFRLSGTGTEGATLRIYLEAIAQDKGESDLIQTLSPLRLAANDLLKLKERFGVEKPTVIT